MSLSNPFPTNGRLFLELALSLVEGTEEPFSILVEGEALASESDDLVVRERCEVTTHKRPLAAKASWLMQSRIYAERSRSAPSIKIFFISSSQRKCF